LQELDGAKLAGQLFVSEKLGSPKIEMLLIVRGALPVLYRVICAVKDCPTWIGLKFTEAGSKTTAGFTGASAVPVATTSATGVLAKADGGSEFVNSPLEEIKNG
jgi:hypothetical protein